MELKEDYSQMTIKNEDTNITQAPDTYLEEESRME